MTLQPFIPNEITPTVVPSGASRILAFGASLNAAAAAMEQLVDTPFLPVSFWPLPNGVQIKDFPNPRFKHPRESAEEHAWRRQVACASSSAAILFGDELGYGPIAALNAVYVVRGRPGLYAEAMVALVKSHGHELVVEELTDARCVIRGRRRNETDWQRFTFTMDRARKAGYVKQNAKYNDDPQTMLYARCSSLASRAIAPDVLKGVASVEEITDELEASDPPARTRTVKRAEVAAAERPSLPAEVTRIAPLSDDVVRGHQVTGPPLPGESPTEVMLQPRTWDQINREFVTLEVVGDGQKAARLAVISHIVGRRIARGQDLTAAEGQFVLDNLVGHAGHEIVAQALGRPEPASAETASAPAEPVTEPDAEEEYDPTLGENWGAEPGADADGGADRD